MMVERLREIRERRGLTLRVLAQKAGIHYISLVRLEKETSGPGSDPRLSTLNKLANALQTTIAELIGERENTKRRPHMKITSEIVQQKKLNATASAAKAALEEWRKKYIAKEIRSQIWGFDYKEIDLIIRLLQLKIGNQTKTIRD